MSLEKAFLDTVFVVAIDNLDSAICHSVLSQKIQNSNPNSSRGNQIELKTLVCLPADRLDRAQLKVLMTGVLNRFKTGRPPFNSRFFSKSVSYSSAT